MKNNNNNENDTKMDLYGMTLDFCKETISDNRLPIEDRCKLVGEGLEILLKMNDFALKNHKLDFNRYSLNGIDGIDGIHGIDGIDGIDGIHGIDGPHIDIRYELPELSKGVGISFYESFYGSNLQKLIQKNVTNGIGYLPIRERNPEKDDENYEKILANISLRKN